MRSAAPCLAPSTHVGARWPCFAWRTPWTPPTSGRARADRLQRGRDRGRDRRDPRRGPGHQPRRGGNLICRVADEVSRDVRLSDDALSQLVDRYGPRDVLADPARELLQHGQPLPRVDPGRDRGRAAAQGTDAGGAAGVGRRLRRSRSLITTRAPFLGTNVTPRRTPPSGRGPRGAEVGPLITLRTTTFISKRAKLAPMQRRVPPPKAARCRCPARCRRGSARAGTSWAARSGRRGGGSPRSTLISMPTGIS